MTSRTVALAAGGLAFVALLALLVVTDLSDPFDRAIIDGVHGSGLRTTLAGLRLVTELGSTIAITLVAGLALLVGVFIGPWRHGVIGAVTIGLASLVVEGVKVVVARTRPEVLDPIVVEHGYSFPSGHATLSMVGYGILVVLLARSRLPPLARVGLVGVSAMLVLLIGLSRIYLGVHFPSDVLAGWVLGAVVVLVFADLTRGVSREPAAVAVDADPAGRRSDRPAAG